MDTKEKTLQALSTFLETQKNLLSRTQADLSLLRTLRQDVEHNGYDAEDAREELCELDVTMDEYRDESILKQLDWAAFDGLDPTPLMTFEHSLRFEQNRLPQKSQQSPLSSLQQAVKSARKSMIDPIMPSLLDLSAELPDPELLKEQDTIHALRTRKIVSCGGLTISSVRKHADETMDVDIDHVNSPQDLVTMESSSRASTRRSITPIPLPIIQESRKRRPSTRRKDSHSNDVTPVAGPSTTTPRPARTGKSAPARSKRKVPTPKQENEPSLPPAQPSEDEGPPSKKSSYAKGPKSDTYKQTWSDSEQNLLEKLLDDIPSTEKNRWLKISKAMDGRRTARQVASRVQKYFQKLAQHGLVPAGSSVKPEG